MHQGGDVMAGAFGKIGWNVLLPAVVAKGGLQTLVSITKWVETRFLRDMN